MGASQPGSVNALPLIEAKRDGKVLSEREIHSIVGAFTRHEIPDYQVAALLILEREGPVTRHLSPVTCEQPALSTPYLVICRYRILCG